MRKNIFWGCLVGFVACFFFGTSLFSANLVLGDWTSVSTQEQITFDGDGNKIIGFKQMNGGFLFQDADTSCSFNAVFPVSGEIDVKGGDLYLQQDMIFANSSASLKNTADTAALVFGGDHILEFAQEMEELLHSFTFDNAHIFLNSDLTIKSPLYFKGECTINGRGNRVFVQDNGSINLDSTADLLLAVGGIRLDKSDIFNFNSDISKARFQDFDIELTSDIWFQDGHFEFWGDVTMSGPYTFTYDSTKTSTITDHATLRLKHDATLKIGKKAGQTKQPLAFETGRSRFILDNSGLNVTDDGLLLTKGSIKVHGCSVLTVASDDIAKGLILGSGAASNDVLLKIKNGSELEVVSGALVLNEYASDKVEFDGDCSQLRLNGTSKLYTHRPLDLVGGSIRLSSAATIDKAASAYIAANKMRLHDTYQDLCLTGSIVTQDSLLLDLSDELILKSGDLSKLITVSQDNNALHGDGVISGYVIFADANTSLTWAIDAKVGDRNTLLNGGTLALDRDLHFYQNLQGPPVGGQVASVGKLELDNHAIRVAANDMTWASSFHFVGNGSRMVFNAKVSLSGTTTIEGIHTIDGNGHILEFGPAARLFVASGSTLIFCNITIKNLSGTKISCLDDTSQVIFDNVKLVQDDDFKFETGSIIFRNQVDLTGGDGCSAASIYSFLYESSQTSSIDSNSTLRVGRGVRFELGNQDWQASTQPLGFSGLTSVLHLDDSRLRVKDQGVQFKKGRMRVSDSSMLEVDTTYGFTVGNGMAAAQDFIIEIEGDARLTIDGGVGQGVLYYNNYENEDKIVFVSLDATIRISKPNGLTASRDLFLKNGTINFPLFDNFRTLGSAVIDQYYMKHLHDVPYAQHLVEGRFQTGVGYLLVDDGFVISMAGRMVEPVLFDEGMSFLGGIGVIQSLLTLKNHNTTLMMGFESDLGNNIVMNGGTLLLSTHLNFVGDKTLTGSGTVVLNDNRFGFGTDDISLDHEICWDMSSAVNLGAKTSLSGTWTFKGTGNLNGHGNVLDLRSGGRIFIDDDATLYINDLVIEGLGEGLLLFGNSNSKVHMSNVSVVLTSNYSTNIGGIYVEGPTTWYFDTFNWTFDQLGSLTVDGMTLWKDPLDEVNGGDILFGSPVANHLSLINSGTIKEVVDSGGLANQVTNLGDDITNINADLDLLFLYFSTIDHGPYNYIFNTNITQTFNIYLGPHHKMFLQEDLNYNGSTWYIHFSRASEPLLYIDPGKTVTLHNVVLKDFHPDYVSYGDANSNLVFGGGTTIEFIEDFTLTRQWTFTGDAKVKGFETKIALGVGGIIDVYDSSSLTLEDLSIAGLSSITNNLRCRTNDGSIVVKDSELMLSNDYALSTGGMRFVHESKLTGTNRFVYATSMTSTLATESLLYVDHGVTFSYCPPTADRNLFVMTDTTSKLHLNGAVLHSTSTGMMLRCGMVLFDNYVTLSAEGLTVSEAIALGDPADADGVDDVVCCALGGAYIETFGYIDMK